MPNVALDHQLPRDVLAYSLGFLADPADLFKEVVTLRLVSARLRDAVNETLHQYSGGLILPTLAPLRRESELENRPFRDPPQARRVVVRLDPKHYEHAIREAERLFQHVLPLTPSITEIDFGGPNLRPTPTLAATCEVLHRAVPSIAQLDLSMVQGIQNFSFIGYYAKTLTLLCLHDVPQEPEHMRSLSGLSECCKLTTLVLSFRDMHYGARDPYRRVDFQDGVLNACNRLSFLDGAVAGSLEHLTLIHFHFSVNREEDHSLAKAVSLKSLALNWCRGLRHVFFIRRMANLENLGIHDASIAHRRSKRTMRMLAGLAKLKTLSMNPCLWLHHLAELESSPSIQYIILRMKGLLQGEFYTNASGEPVRITNSLCFGEVADFPDEEYPPSDTDDEYL